MGDLYAWDRKTVLELANIYRKYEILWDPKHSDYKNKQCRRQALTAIADEMNIEKSEIERKFKNISSHYMREVKRERESEMLSTVYKSKWFAYNALKFLNNRPPHLRMPSLINRTNYSAYATVSNDGDETSQNSDQSEQITSDASYEMMPKRRKLKSEDPLIASYETMTAECTSTTRDDSSTFANYISTKIRSMDKKTKTIVEYEINSIIFKAEMGVYGDKKYDYEDE